MIRDIIKAKIGSTHVSYLRYSNVMYDTILMARVALEERDNPPACHHSSMDCCVKDKRIMITPQFDSSLLEHKAYTYGKKYSVNQSELDAIEKLHSVGIFAQPGRITHFKYADVVAWGCILVEVRTAHLSKDGSYRWRVKASRVDADVIRGHLMMLVKIDTSGNKSHHLFPVWHEVFYTADGSMKKGMNYRPGGGRGKQHPEYGLAMNDAIMKEHQDRWDLIENARQHIGRSYSIENIRKALVLPEIKRKASKKAA